MGKNIRATMVWGELAQPDAIPHRDEKQIVVPNTYPRSSTLEALLGAGGTAVGIDTVRSGGDGLYTGLCLLLPLSLLFLYAGAAGLWDCYKVWRTYGGNRNATT